MTDLDEPGSGASGSANDGDGTPDGERAQARRRTDASAQPGRPAKGRRGLSALRETVVVLGSALVLSLLIKTFLVQAFYIPSQSMETTLDIGDRVLVSRLVPGPLDLNRGDIVVFVDPGGWLDDAQTETDPVRSALVRVGEFVGLLPANTGSHLIKRVIGMPGDHVTCCDTSGRITVNGVGIDEPYVIDGAVPSEITFDVTVPEGSVWVMGDNRSDSRDSRYHLGDSGGGMVPIDNVVGVAKVTIWPADRWTILRSPGATFADVPDPS
ncbi:MAG TPA: signal peptidase I [Micrococcales bacterium]|uniref:signal peptidase I n=1 Tax=Miniimonas arenae TaxID=676201 RepID=UPI000EC0903B|nr:signal peptidase I [Miniimonas arenae]HCX85700.1 signal peptidase I [Micrococcales bacterium]